MNRRNLLSKVWHIQESVEKFVLLIVIVYVSSLLLTPYFDFSHSVKTVLTGTHVFVFVLLIIYFIAYLFLRSPNRKWSLVLTKDDCKVMGQWLKDGQSTNFLNKDTCKFKFATTGDLDVLANLNFEAFHGSAYEVSLERIKTRNAEFISQNDKCFMLMIDPIDGKDIIGYSCLLPLTKDGAEIYLDGSISDAKMPGSFVAKPGDNPAAILIFAINLRNEYSLAKYGASRKYSLYFWSCIRLHIELFNQDFGGANTFPPVYAQTAEKSLEKRLKRIGFTNTKIKTGDGYYIWEFKVQK